MHLHFPRTLVELGAANAAWYVLARGLRLLGCGVWRYHFMAQPVATNCARRAPGSLALGPIATLGDMPHSCVRPREVLAARFRQGGHCIAAWNAGELAGFLWYQFGAYQEDEVRARYLLPSPDSCWDYDVFVQPHLRLGTTFCRLWDEAHRRMHARGIQWACSRISAFNPASLRAHRRLGAIILGSASFFTLGRWQLMLADRPPYIHLSSRPDSWPQLVFDTRLLEDGAATCQAS